MGRGGGGQGVRSLEAEEVYCNLLVRLAVGLGVIRPWTKISLLTCECYGLYFLTSISGHWECKDNSKWQQQQIWKIPGDFLWQEPPHNRCPHEDILVGKITCCVSSTRRKKLSHLLSDVCCLWHPRAQRSQTWYVDLLVNIDWKSVISITIWKQ